MAVTVTVTVHSNDPLALAGALSHLRHQPALEVVEPSTPPAGDSVAVVLTQRVDESTAVELRRLVREPGRRVVLVTDQLREPELMAVLEFGVRTILWRAEATQSRLIGAIRSAAQGDSKLPPDLLGQLIAHVSRAQRAASDQPSMAVPAVGLAPREVDVLKLVAEGLDTQQIADKLAYSERTIKNVLHGVMSRLQLRNRAHAVAYALREGYI
jgi:DNA-binding NarL/FixJ family response regulator